MPEFFVSAPGKVILFGEHSAVYGKPAIAAALSLRAYLSVQPSANKDEIVLEFPDISLSHSWKISEIPWKSLSSYLPANGESPQTTEELVPEILDALADLLSDLDLALHFTACRCFLYLYTILCGPEVSGHHFCIRSTLPIGAGLGSSASTAVCLAAGLGTLGSHVNVPEHGAAAKVTRSHSKDADFIDAWSLMGEKCFHGNPSGIDNTVATHGGAVLYQRMSGPGNPSIRTAIRNFSALNLLLTNSKVPRSTAQLVGNVAVQNSKFPQVSGSILDAMSHLATDAYQLMLTPFFDHKSLQELVNINHGLLVSLGVSHPALEKIKIISDTHGLGATKLTGAGGGGCAITLLKDDLTNDILDNAKKELELAGFDTFTGLLGGKGVGLLDSLVLDKAAVTRFLSDLLKTSEVEALVGASVVDGWKFW